MHTKALLLALAASSAAWAQSISIGFTGATDFADNFRRVATITSSHSISQSGGLLNVTGSTVATNAVVYAYDTTPANNTVQNTFSLSAGQTLTVSIQFANLSANGAGSSIGFYFGNPTSESSSTSFLALLNINTVNEQIRFASNANVGTAAGGSLANGSFASNADAGLGVSDPIFRTVTASYTYNSASSVSMSMTAGSVTSTQTFSSVSSLSNVMLALRIAPAAGSPARTLQLDNFAITTPIPESSSFAAFTGLGALLACFNRRRRRA